MPANIPTTNIDELGNPQHAGTVRDLAEVTATVQAMDVSVKLFSVLTATDPDSYPGAGVDISELGNADIIGVIRDDSAATYAKSVHLRQCRVNGFTFTYSINGEATEEYTLEGSEKRWFKHDVVVDAFTDSDSSPLSLSETPLQLKNSNYIISYQQDGVYFSEVAGSPSAGDGEYQYNAGTIVLADAISSYAVAVYHSNNPGSTDTWSDVSDSTIPAAIRGKDISIEIAANSLSRVQSVTIRGTLPVERVEEMGNQEVVGYITQVPDVTGDITVLDTDLELVALLTTGDKDSSDTEFGICGYTATGISLEIQLEEPGDACDEAAPTVLKTVYIPEITITSEGHTTNVGGSAQQTFNFRSETGQCIVYSGARA